MKVIPFELNSPSMRYEYHRTREGPNWFLCYYKNSSIGTNDPKEAWRTLGVAKFTDTGKALKEWCLSMHEQYNSEEKEGYADNSFANESRSSEEDPTTFTKMVT